jgi:hypothetical protein
MCTLVLMSLVASVLVLINTGCCPSNLVCMYMCVCTCLLEAFTTLLPYGGGILAVTSAAIARVSQCVTELVCLLNSCQSMPMQSRQIHFALMIEACHMPHVLKTHIAAIL